VTLWSEFWREFWPVFWRWTLIGLVVGIGLLTWLVHEVG